MVTSHSLRRALDDGDLAHAEQFFAQHKHMNAALHLEAFLATQPEWFCVAASLAPALATRAGADIARACPDAWLLADRHGPLEWKFQCNDAAITVAEWLIDDASGLAARLPLSVAFCVPSLMTSAIAGNDPTVLELLLTSTVFCDQYTSSQRQLVLSGAMLKVLDMPDSRDLVNMLIGHGGDLETLELKSRLPCITGLSVLVKNGVSMVGFPHMFCADSLCETDAQFVREMLRFGADSQSTRDGGWARLPICRNLEILELLVNDGFVDVDYTRYPETRTPLMLTVGSGADAVAMARVLLDHNADVAHRDWFGRTALIYATIESSLEVVQMLLEHGADPNVSDCMRRTALFHVVERQQPSVPITKLLLHHGADPLVRDKTANSVLDTSMGTPQCTEVVHVLTKHLADRGLDINGDPNI